jgi:hypothetical protein
MLLQCKSYVCNWNCPRQTLVHRAQLDECSSVISIHILLVCVRCEVILIRMYGFVYVILYIRFGLYNLV